MEKCPNEAERSKNEEATVLKSLAAEAAVNFLKHRGYAIIARDWKCPAGKADIIANDDGCITFVEVAVETDINSGFPSEDVSDAKRKSRELVAALFLQDNAMVDMSVRFDTISILMLDKDRGFIRHHINVGGGQGE